MLTSSEGSSAVFAGADFVVPCTWAAAEKQPSRQNTTHAQVSVLAEVGRSSMQGVYRRACDTSARAAGGHPFGFSCRKGGPPQMFRVSSSAARSSGRSVKPSAPEYIQQTALPAP